MPLTTVWRHTQYGIKPPNLALLVSREKGPWIYAERPADTVLTWLTSVAGTELPWDTWRHGRIFGPERELAWWREADGVYTCRLLTLEKETDPAWDQAEEYVAVDDEPQFTLLHGLLDEEPAPSPTWSEARIPRYLPYPVEATNLTPEARAVLLTRHYRGTSGDILSRLMAVETLTPET